MYRLANFTQYFEIYIGTDDEKNYVSDCPFKNKLQKHFYGFKN